MRPPILLATVLSAVVALTTAATPSAPQAVSTARTALPSVNMAAVVVASQVEPRIGNRPALGDDASTRLVQRALAARGFAAAADGYFGAGTVSAYTKFQRSLGYSGLGANGIPGPASLAKLGSGRFAVTNKILVGSRTTYGGKPVNARTRAMLVAADAKLPWTIRLTQGSYNLGRVPESGGTHDGGGALDVNLSGLSQTQTWRTVQALRAVGFAAWYRPATSSWGRHIHAIAIGDTDLSRQAANQVGDYYAGDAGLQGTARDNTPTAYRVPFTWWEKVR